MVLTLQNGMSEFFVQSELSFRLGVFVSLLLMLSGLEYFFPRRQLLFPKIRRWFSNISLSIINTLFVKLVFPITVVGVASLLVENEWGLFNQFVVPAWLSVMLFLLLFDVVIYWQHRLFHVVPFLWRLHRVHHTDLDYDVSTAIRFHPLEIFLSACIKLILVVALGPVPIAVVLAEVILNATSLFNHSNLSLPEKMDKRLRLLVVTPDMHRVHHSVAASEHNQNFGFNFPWWDRLFKTYRAQPLEGHKKMNIGLEGFQVNNAINLSDLLLQPFNKR